MVIYIWRDGRPQPAEMQEWDEYFWDVAEGRGEPVAPGAEVPTLRHVAYTEWPEVQVSTVFLGLDHQFGSGPPLLFETVIFWPDHELDNYCERYSTKADAEAGHQAVVAMVRAAREG